MKMLVKAVILFAVAITLAACQKAENPVAPSLANKTSVNTALAANSGIFKLTLPDSRATGQTSTLSGTITFSFFDATSTYKYEYSVDNPNADVYSLVVEHSGKFERKGDQISLVNDPTVAASHAQVDIILDGTFQYSERGNQIIIKGDANLGYIEITLNK